jgi:osmotically-inducible protein OsmY
MHRDVDEKKIRITVEKGILTLEGCVSWNFQRRAAVDLLRVLKGVRGINNYIQVHPEVRSENIRESIRQSLARNARLDADNIYVKVEGSKVMLQGTVSSLAEGDDVEYAAWSAPGVTAVENKLVIVEEGDED